MDFQEYACRRFGCLAVGRSRCDSAKIEENGQDIVYILNRIQYIVVIRKENKMSLNNVKVVKKDGTKE